MILTSSIEKDINRYFMIIYLNGNHYALSEFKTTQKAFMIMKNLQAILINLNQIPDSPDKKELIYNLCKMMNFDFYK